MLLLAGAPAFAQAGAASDVPSPAQQERIESHIDRLAAKLNLDAASTARLKATLERYHAQLGPLFQQQFQTRRALKEELAAPQPNASKLSQLTDQLTANREEIQAIEARKSAELKQQLTPQQYAQLVVSRHEMMGRRFHRKANGQRGPQ
jgi:Spy/CpxP family protein refolding chaperone